MGSDSNHGTQGVIYADRNDGGQHGAAYVKRKAPMCSLQQIAKAGTGIGSRGSSGSRFAGGSGWKAREAASDMVDGAGSGGRSKYHRSPATSRGRRHSH